MTKPIKENELSKQKTVRITAFSDVPKLNAQHGAYKNHFIFCPRLDSRRTWSSAYF